jgi:hypothetical protein
LRSIRYRLHPVGSPTHHRCASYVWCSPCRRFTGQTVYVPGGRVLPDPLGDLAPGEREVLSRNEGLVPHLDRTLTRSGLAPLPRWVIAPEPIEATSLLRDYFTDVASSYYGRPVTAASWTPRWPTTRAMTWRASSSAVTTACRPDARGYG